MKKVFLLLLFTSILTGCGMPAMETINCSYQSNTDTLSTNIMYNIDYQGEEVKKVRITYDYMVNTPNDNTDLGTDGVGTGTDGTTNDTEPDEDGIVDGIVGSAIDTVIGAVTDTILDVAGIRDRHNIVLNTYGEINGFSVTNTDDLTDNNYRVTYVIDYDTISDADLSTLGLSRDINTLKDNYTSQGLICG